MRRVLVALVVLVVAMISGARPAVADPARPGNVRSTVRSVEPATDAVTATVVGGDAFLRLEVAAGHEVIVLGYEGEPYLRFRPDGTVEENERSKATYLNQDRLAGTPVPPGIDPTAPPVWREVASGGAFEFHDHRIHWMGQGRPPIPQAWEVPLVVDGTDVAVTGRFEGVASPTWWPWALAGVAALAGLVAAGRRWRPAAPVAVVVAGVVALPLAWATATGPGQTGAGRWADPVLVLVAVVAAAVALALDRRSTGTAGAFVAGAGASLALWAWGGWDVVTHAVLPLELPTAYQRAAVVLGLAAGGAAVVAGSIRVVQGGATDRASMSPWASQTASDEPPAS